MFLRCGSVADSVAVYTSAEVKGVWVCFCFLYTCKSLIFKSKVLRFFSLPPSHSSVAMEWLRALGSRTKPYTEIINSLPFYLLFADKHDIFIRHIRQGNVKIPYCHNNMMIAKIIWGTPEAPQYLNTTGNLHRVELKWPFRMILFGHLLVPNLIQRVILLII